MSFSRRNSARHNRGRAVPVRASGGGDVTAPVISAAAVPAAGTTLTLTYGENLDTGSVPAAGDFALSGTNATVASVGIVGAVCTLTFTVPLYVVTGETVTVSYTPGSNKLRDAAGNNCVALTNRAVTNSSTLPVQLTGADATQTYSFTGSVSGQSCTGRIYLPAGYDPTSGTTYPIFVVMHGKGGTSATTNTNVIPEFKDAIAAGQMGKAIVVMPDSDGADFGMDATGVGTGTTLAETKITDDVLPHVEARTRWDGKIVGSGFSMGGYSIARIAMNNVGLFAAIWLAAVPNMDANPVSGTVNNWRYTNDAYTDTGANDGDDIRRMVGPTGTAPQIAATLAALEALSPFASKNGGALANVNTAAIIASLPIFITKSAGDATSLAHMNQASLVLTALNIPHGFVDLVSPGHSQQTYYQTAQGTSTIAAGNGFMYLEAALAGTDVIAPRISGTPTINAAGTELTITFDKSLTANSPTAAQFSLGGLPTGCAVSSAAASGTSVVLTLNCIVPGGTTGVTVSMASADAAVKVLSAAGVPASPRTAVAVDNTANTATAAARLAGLVTSVSWHYLFLASTGVTDAGAGAVSAITDQSGAGHNISQGTSGNRPVVSASSGPNGTTHGITHDGTDDNLPTSAFDIAAPGTTAFYELLVFKQLSWTSLDRITGRPGGNMQIRQAGTTPALTMNNTTGANSNTAATLNSWFRMEAGFTGSTSDFLKIGSTNVTGASAGTVDPASGSSIVGSVAGGTNAGNFVWSIWGATAGIPNGTERANIDKFILGLYGTTVGL